jgi:hypothetical protein
MRLSIMLLFNLRAKSRAKQERERVLAKSDYMWGLLFTYPFVCDFVDVLLVVRGTILIFWWMVLIGWGNLSMGSASCGGNMLWVW